MLNFVFKYGKIQTKLYPRTYSIDELNKITMPTMLLVGDNEVIYHPADAFKRAGKGIPILTTQLLPNCGHAIPTDQPELTANAIARFFK
jgi:pimeloyl-ACP methyl ester carboxylesterase